MRCGWMLACVIASGVFAGEASAWQVKPATEVPAKAREEMERLVRERQNAAATAPPAEATPPTSTEPAPITWTEPEFESFGAMLTGSWTSGASGLLMHIAPVAVEGLPNALYCEVSAADSPRAPFRQTVLALSRVNGKMRLTTWEFRRPGGRIPSATWSWAVPVAFPKVSAAEDLIGTLALEFNSGGGSYIGRTPHPYPTGAHGAVEMTSELLVRNGVIELADRGFGPDGSQVWGPAAGTRTGFTRTDLGMQVVLKGGGLASVTLPTTLSGDMPKPGDMCSVHYTAYLSSGAEFDSSYKRGTPFTYKQGQPLIPGWNALNDDLRAGMIRRIFVPTRFAWGSAGRTNQVPPNTDVVYDLEVVKIETPPPPPPVEGTPGEAPKLEIRPAEGGGQSPPPVKAVPVPDPK
ncbi:MAG: hypothetical protein HBSAPP03_17190 [Phycisphaerae bacterium]|nr:MAG: hypothetical protein HBSAPP03_17190 [Phycisphaerae bacterium]